MREDLGSGFKLKRLIFGREGRRKTMSLATGFVVSSPLPSSSVS